MLLLQYSHSYWGYITFYIEHSSLSDKPESNQMRLTRITIIIIIVEKGPAAETTDAPQP
jgi:hypothetical protein